MYTLLELKEALTDAGFRCAAASAAVAEAFGYEAVRCRKADEKDRAELQAFSKKIKEKLDGQAEGRA